MTKALGVLAVVLVAGAIYEPLFPWPFDKLGITPVAQAAQAGATLTPPPPGTKTPATDTTDAQSRLDVERKDLEARIDANEKAADAKISEELEGAKVLLGALVGLTALSSLIIGFVTYMSVKYARDEAKDQVEIFRKRIDELAASFPEFGGLDERIRQKLREVEVLLPSEANWNEIESFKSLQEEDKQEILDNEIAISASVSVFGLDRSPMMRARLVSIYSAFARFYSSRYEAMAAANEGDYVRALSYASRAIKLKPNSVEGYRLRGAIYLARYDKAAAVTPQNQKDLKEFLDLAEVDLKFATAKKDPMDAGAYYDMALLQNYRKNIAGAVRTSRDLIDQKDKISAMHREKYLPDTYRNLACYLAMQAKDASTDPERKSLSEEAVNTVKSGLDTFKTTANALDSLKKGIEAELKTQPAEPGKPQKDGDLLRLEKKYQDEITTLLTTPIT